MRFQPLFLTLAALALACGGDLPDKPQIEPDRTEILFGGEFGEGTWVGATGRETLQLRNGGASDLQITDAVVQGTDASLFAAKLSSKTAASEQKVFVELTYVPAAAGKHTAELVITSNAENTPTLKVPLKATAIAPPQ